MKKWKLGLLVILLMSFSLVGGTAFAQEEKLIKTELIQSEPINLMRYVISGADYVWEIFSKLLESGKPVLLFDAGAEGGLEVVFFENVPKENFNLVGGWTILNDQPGKFFWGFEYEITTSEESIFQRLRPSLLFCEGRFLFGVGFELRE